MERVGTPEGRMGTMLWVTIAMLGMAIYVRLDPFNHSPIAGFPEFNAYFVDHPPWSELPFPRDHNNRLQKAEIQFLNEVSGPESLAFDPHNRGPYTGVADGRIMRWEGPEIGWSEFAYTSSNRSELCIKPQVSSPLAYVKYEHICGRPLGLRFNRFTGDLYIADAYFGLLVVGPGGGLATPLVTEAEGIPLRFANDLDIDKDGNVYFTDSSVNYQRKNFLQLVFSAENSGRVLKYGPVTKKTEVLVRDIQFPNGLSLSNDESFFVFAESCTGRLRRYWLKGPKAGLLDLFAILPGYPDNVRANDKGEFWVAIHSRYNWLSYFLARHPHVRMVFLRLPISARIQYLLYIGGQLHAMVAKYSPDGELLEVLEDRVGKVVRAVSEVEERDGKLWMGSVLTKYIAVY